MREICASKPAHRRAGLCVRRKTTSRWTVSAALKLACALVVSGTILGGLVPHAPVFFGALFVVPALVATQAFSPIRGMPIAFASLLIGRWAGAWTGDAHSEAAAGALVGALVLAIAGAVCGFVVTHRPRLGNLAWPCAATALDTFAGDLPAGAGAFVGAVGGAARTTGAIVEVWRGALGVPFMVFASAVVIQGVAALCTVKQRQFPDRFTQVEREIGIRHASIPALATVVGLALVGALLLVLSPPLGAQIQPAAPGASAPAIGGLCVVALVALVGAATASQARGGRAGARR